MKRKIIKIDEDKCIGCGLCAEACHEGAIGMVEGKAKLLREDYCDGLGDCLPACPVAAITFEEREAPAYDAEAVRQAIAAGVDCCGENRVQELTQKLAQNAYEGAPVHFIGHLQTNKVKQVVGKVDLIQSVDSERLLAAIQKEAEKQVAMLWNIGKVVKSDVGE